MDNNANKRFLHSSFTHLIAFVLVATLKNFRGVLLDRDADSYEIKTVPAPASAQGSHIGSGSGSGSGQNVPTPCPAAPAPYIRNMANPYSKS